MVSALFVSASDAASYGLYVTESIVTPKYLEDDPVPFKFTLTPSTEGKIILEVSSDRDCDVFGELESVRLITATADLPDTPGRYASWYHAATRQENHSRALDVTLPQVSDEAFHFAITLATEEAAKSILVLHYAVPGNGGDYYAVVLGTFAKKG